MVTNTPDGKASALSLAVYSRIVDPLNAIQVLGRSIALSQLLGAATEHQGQLIAMECLASGVPPLSLKRRYHFTKFGLIQQSSWTMAEFQKAGGKVKELSRTADLARAVISLGEESYDVSLSWEVAKNEPFPYEGKEKDTLDALADPKKPRPMLKAKYRTPLSRAQMLWWRLVNDCIRSHWPEINGGMYSAEEIAPDEASEADGEAAANVVEAEFQVVESPASGDAVETAEVSQDGGEVESQPNAASATPQTVETAPVNPGDPCTAEQRTAVGELFVACADRRSTRENPEKLEGQFCPQSDHWAGGRTAGGLAEEGGKGSGSSVHLDPRERA